MGKFVLFVSMLLLSISTAGAQTFQLKKSKCSVNSSFRSLSVVNNQVAWVGGSNGWIGRSTNGGKSWKFSQVKGFETVGFRSLYAFDDKNAVIANAGAPANILVTKNGGESWSTVYTNSNEAAFFDGIDFWNDKEGIIYGDAIEGKMLLLQTDDGGNSWSEVANRPELATDEASFAASGTGIRCMGKSGLMIATGGVVSRLLVSDDKGLSWSTLDVPIIQGEKTTGIYSVSVNNANINVVGGDYTKPTMDEKHNLYSNDYGKTWLTPSAPTRGYRECVEYIKDNTLLAAGPTGIDVSNDGGANWQALSDEAGFHVLRKARNGSLIIVAGNNGQISILETLRNKNKLRTNN